MPLTVNSGSIYACSSAVLLCWLQALVAFKLYKSMAHEVEDMGVASPNELLSYAQLVNFL